MEKKRLRLGCVLLCAGLCVQAATITRATAHINGVTSPRGFFNITVGLYRIPGVEWAKYDLKKSMITLDFEPGASGTPEQVQSAMSLAGYKPGAVKVDTVEAPAVHEKRLGWNKILRPKSKNAVARWFELNF